MFQIKLHVPCIGRKSVSRRRIAKKLQNIFDYRLTLITAPAGYGKTTTAAGFLTETAIPHAWLSLDPEDNDPVRFWQYLTAAVGGAYANLADSLGDLTLSRELIASNIFTGLFIDQLYCVSGNFILVLDDYHLIQDETVRQSLVYFIKNKPSSFHLIILSRQEQDNDLSGLSAKGQALRIGRWDLAFSAGEIMEFYQQKGIRLTPEEVSNIEARTEGWAVGFVISSLAIEEGADIQDVLDQLSGSSRYLDRYFREEVFERWPGRVRDFLMRTSILDRLNGPICRAVTGREDSAEILRKLSEGNSFIIPLDQKNEWFRYHHLFAEFLRTRLEQENPSVIKSLYGLAGAWLHENGLVREAIDALIRAEDFPRAVALFGDSFANFANNGEFPALAKWLSSFPKDYYENNVRLCSAYAWVLAMEGHWEEADEWSQRTVACFHRIRDRLDDVRERNYMAVQAAIIRADNAIRRLDAATAARCYTEAGKVELDDHILTGELNLGQPSMLRTVYGFYGRLNDLEKAVFPFIKDFPGMIGKASAYSKVILIESLYERNSLKESHDSLVQGLEEAFALDNPGVIVPCFITLAKIHRAGGDLDGALNTVAEGKKKLHGKGRTYWEYLFDLFTARLYLDRHDLQGAEEWMDLGRIGIYDCLSCIREFEHLVLARYLCLANRHEEALLLLGRLLALAEKEGRLGSRIEILCLMAVANCLGRDPARAMALLDQALSLGMEHGYARTFIDEMDPMAGLLDGYPQWKDRAGSEEMNNYAKKLYQLTAAGITANRGKLTGGDMAAETLTRKEYKVLQLLSSGRSNDEIAGELSITVRTVKYHNANLYGKLGARNRLEALNRARQLGLLQ